MRNLQNPIYDLNLRANHFETNPFMDMIFPLYINQQYYTSIDTQAGSNMNVQSTYWDFSTCKDLTLALNKQVQNDEELFTNHKHHGIPKAWNLSRIGQSIKNCHQFKRSFRSSTIHINVLCLMCSGRYSNLNKPDFIACFPLHLPLYSCRL